jgi:hypothetical protein
MGAPCVRIALKERIQGVYMLARKEFVTVYCPFLSRCGIILLCLWCSRFKRDVLLFDMQV